MHDSREVKAKVIAQTRAIKEVEGGYAVQSQTSKRLYFVNSHDWSCTCPDCQFNQVTRCKHVRAVKYWLGIEKIDANGAKTIEKVRLTYPQAWEAYNKAQTSEVEQFDVLLKDLLESVEEPTYEFGRPQLSQREVLFCAIKKVYSQMSSRRAKGLFNQAQAREVIKSSPHFNAVSKLWNEEQTAEILNKLVALSAQPLKSVETTFAIDSTGFRTTSYSQYCQEKHGADRQQKWVKLHAVCGTKTNVITSVDITDNNSGDSKFFAPLMTNTKDAGFNIEKVVADKAYNSINNYNLIQEFGGQAYIPYKSNITAHCTSGNKARLWRKMFHYFQMNQEEFMQHYHARSNAETTFHMLKSKLGDGLKSKNFVAQKNELLCKILAHNIMVLNHETHELGITSQVGVI